MTEQVRGGEEAFAREPGLASRFADQARLRPDAVAVTCDGASITYADLDRRANQLANHLRTLGVGRESLVGLCMDRSIELIVGMLGIVKASAAYLPLDLVYPRDRLAFMLEDASAPVVLTLSRNRGAIPDTGARVVCLDEEDELVAAGVREPPRADDPEMLAYVIYTSGSTGTPKGCQVTQGNVVRLFTATRHWLGYGPEDVWSCFHSQAFDFSVFEIWGALLHGGRVVLVPQAITRSPGQFRRLLAAERVTVLSQTPSAFLQLMRSDLADPVPVGFALRLVVFGGEALELQQLAPWLERYGDESPRLVNMYGITETTVHVTYRPITIEDLRRGAGSVIGVPIPDLTLRILDESMRPAADGSVGEIYVGGAGVSRGYLNRPDLNAQRFILWSPPGVMGAVPERLYRSGDLARRLADGDIEYLGRSDTQVKIRGYRIETGEIEAALARHPAIQACAVIARGEVQDEKTLIAYFVPAGQQPSPQELRAHLMATLPDYMVPSAFVAMDEMPLTVNGKLDRSSLPMPGPDRPELSAGFEPAATPEEASLCAAFGELLGIEAIGRNDNFFELGGNSILAMRLLDRIRSSHRSDVATTKAPLATLSTVLVFEHPTPARMAAALARQAMALSVPHAPALDKAQFDHAWEVDADCHQQEARYLADLPAAVKQAPVSWNEAGSITCHHDSTHAREAAMPEPKRIRASSWTARREPSGQTVPTTEAQREIWLAAQLGREASLAFNLSLSLRLHGHCDYDALRHAVRGLVVRHDALRSTISADGESIGLVDAGDFDLPIIDLATHLPLQPEEAVSGRIRRSVETPFALERDLPFRAELLRTGSDDHVLLLSAHHVACDGWSWGILVRELAVLYCQHLGVDVPPLPAPDTFCDYAVLESQRRAGKDYADDEAYWLSRFSRSQPVLDLPVDRPRPKARSFSSAREDIELDQMLATRLRQFGARHGAGLFATLMAAFAATLARLSGDQEVVIGVPAADQLACGRENLVGHCVNMLPLRLDLANDLAFGDLLRYAQRCLLDAMGHQRYAFGELLKKLRMRRDAGRMPLVSVMFNIDQGFDGQRDAFHGLSLDCEVNPRSFDAFELFLNVMPRDGRLKLECQYNTDLFDAATVRRWLHSYETFLRGALDSPELPARAIPLVDPVAYAELAALQPEAVRFDRRCLMHEHFERQCDQAPDRVAVEFNGVTLSYLALEQRANRIAGLLRTRGIGRGDLVGLALDRGFDMVAALLGVLKAGAGYVPLDPGFPPGRLAYMVADAGIGLLLADKGHPDASAMVGPTVSCVGLLEDELAAMPSQRLPRVEGDGMEDDVAYVIYTSGSTGRPKGVQVPHRAVSNFLTGMRHEPGLSADDRLLAVTTLSFDIAVLELLLPLSVGARVVLADRATAADGGALAALLADTHATVMQATPSTWRMLIDAGWPGREGFKVLCGGEALGPDLALALLDRCGALWNLYGPTETTVWSTVARIRGGGASEVDVHIGRPTANTCVWVVDPQGQLCPHGVPGELCIGGEGVTLGYLGREDLTAERFVPDRFSQGALGAQGAGVETRLLYRTGDRGRWRADGSLAHLGRLDHQVKVRGYRIEPGEIEGVIAGHEGVARALVVVREDKPNDQRLVAYVVPKPRARIEHDELRARLSGTLPGYMIPQHIVVLDAIPLLPNGKIDRSALPPPALAPALHPAVPGTENDLSEPRLRYLAAIWSEMLGAPVDPRGNFFELGGHSMLAMQMVNRVQRELGVRINLIRLGTDTLEHIAADLPLPSLADRPSVPTFGQRIGQGLRKLFGLRSAGHPS